MELGLGFYRFRDEGDNLLTDFIKAGGTIVDAAPNYSNGKAHDLIGSNRSASDALTVWSKVGFPSSKDIIRSRIAQQIVSEHEFVGDHALNPAIIRAELYLSSAAHPKIPIDALSLHNPELQFERLTKRLFWDLMKHCIEELELACVKGSIRRWGISVWEGLFGASTKKPRFSVEEWEEAACNVAGPHHHFELVQMPLSLARVNVIAPFLQRNTGPIAACVSLNKKIVASSPMSGGALPKVLEAEFTEVFGKSVTPGQACILFLASLGCVFATLVSPRTKEQLLDVMQVRREPGIERGALCRLVELLITL